MRKRSRGFQLQLLGIVVLPFAIVVATVTSIAVLLHAESMRSIVGVRDERTCAVAATRISQTLLRAQSDLFNVAVRLREEDTPAQALAAYASEAVTPQIRLAVLDAHGRLAAGIEPRGLPGRAAVGGPSSAEYGRVRYSSVISADGVSYAVERLSSGPYEVVAFLPVQEMLQAAIANLPANDWFQVFIVDGSSRVLADIDSAPQREDLARHVGVPEALGGRAGVSYVPGPDTEHVVAFNPIRPPGWALVIEEPWQDDVNPLLRFSLVVPLTLAPALALALLAAWLGASRVVGPLRELESLASRIARGNYPAADGPGRGVAEIRRLRGILVDLGDRVQAGQRTLRGYIARVTHVQEEERRHLARELHDETIQDLIVLDQKVQVLAAAATAKGLPEAAELEALHSAAQEQIGRVRRLSRALRPAYLDELGIMPALGALACDVQSYSRIPVTVRRTGSERDLSPQQSLSIYRIVQEALANAGRHAQARSIWVEVDWLEEAVSVSIRDDGRGFTVPEDTGELSRADHYGIIGMFERASLVGGKLEVASVPDHGTSVTLNLPFSRQT
jgi:signal transduction histidine kinase